MNSQQRKFLVDKITKKTKAHIRLLENSKPKRLDLDVYMLHQVMSSDFEIKSNEELRQLVLEKALKAGNSEKSKEDWLGSAWSSSNRKGVYFTLDEFFVIPEKYKQMQRDRDEEIKKIEQEIADLYLKLETLEIRIMVASDKVLQQIVNDVDDMGDIGLIDTRIKLIE